ncbi:MAG: 4'-phosphopantetheinyl transferase superfamily protein, partial [Gemmatimonadaceae bacterium]|nr:4'-phosphopantetheinyl transferase superfamily protein [Gemmatimonadaceae bacterium]
ATPRAPDAPDIARKVLTERERAAMAHLVGDERDVQVLLRFSFKEALYKAVAPLAGRWIGFSEAEVEISPDGRAQITHRIREAHDAGVVLDAWWERVGPRLITTVRATTA